jgi:hypothetical protein
LTQSGLLLLSSSYSDETPTRVKKNLINSVSHSGEIVVDDLNKILANIGRSDKLLSEEEMSALLQEAGATDRSISTKQVLSMMI